MIDLLINIITMIMCFDLLMGTFCDISVTIFYDIGIDSFEIYTYTS